MNEATNLIEVIVKGVSHQNERESKTKSLQDDTERGKIIEEKPDTKKHVKNINENIRNVERMIESRTEVMFHTTNTEYSLVDETCLESDLKGKAREGASQANSETLQPSTKEELNPDRSNIDNPEKLPPSRKEHDPGV